MRVFISSIDLTGAKRTSRVTIHNCTSTTLLIKQICKELSLHRRNIIIKLKQEPYNLVLLQGWNIRLYPIKNGSTFIIQNIESKDATLQQPLTKIDQEADMMEEQGSQSSGEEANNLESIRMEVRYSSYFEDNLNRMLESVREGNLVNIAAIMKEEPDQIDDEEQLTQVIDRKNSYLLNQVGDCGRNSLHWAIHMNNLQVVSFLLIKGATPNTQTIDQYTPLQLAIQHHAHSIAEILLNHHKIDVNQVTAHGTALHLAVKNEDVKCIQLLLQNDANIDVQDNEGKTAVEVCKNREIGKILSRKAEMGKFEVPCIAKGTVFRVGSTTKRLKERNLLLNPFKNDLTISQLQGQVDQKLQISSIKIVQEIKDRGWLMKNSVSYFKLTLKEQDKSIMFATHHHIICQKWVQSFKKSMLYLQYSQYIKPVLSVDQVVQFMDDQKGVTTKYKRKIYEKPVVKSNNASIMDLKESSSISSSPRKASLKNTEGTSDRSNEQEKLQESQIVLGSVLEVNRYSSQSPSSITVSSFEGSSTPFSLEPTPSQKKQNQSSGFKKKSDKNRVEDVSQFSLTKSAPKISYVDFEVHKLLGNGAFGKVYLAKHKKSGLSYALKVLSKKKLFAKKQLKYAVGETNILKRVNNPFTVKLYYTFQTPSNLYMALDHCPLGDLAELIATKEQLKQRTARFVIAQLILAIQYLHQLGILYRDLKPENILIDRDGYIKLTDFGLSRENSFATSFCGSPAYLSPEMLQKKGVGISSDIYGIGCVLYEMVVGEPPYFNDDMDTLFDNIKHGKLRFPSHMTLELKSLISRLLERNLHKRLGVKDIAEIKKHDFFKKFDWKKLESKKLDVPSEMFANSSEENELGGIQLEVKENIKLVDHDYSEDTNMINRVKNFTFIRGEYEEYEVVPASMLSTKSMQ